MLAPYRVAAAAILCSPLAIGSALAGEIADPLVERGRGLAERMCATCHLNPGQGEKTVASSIPGFAAVARRHGQTLDTIVAWLESVPPMMPNHRLSGDEMAAIAAYILSLAPPPETVNRQLRQ